MSLIKKLTPEQEAMIPEWRDRWLKIALSTEPGNEVEARKSVKRMYKNYRLKEPMILWFSSPFIAILGIVSVEVLKDSQLESQLGSQLRSQLDSQLRSQLESQLRSQLRDKLENKYLNYWSLNFGVYWIAYWSCLQDVLKLEGGNLFDEYKVLANYASCLWQYDRLAIITDFPRKIKLDVQGNLHSDGSYALEYSDGWGFGSWHGVRLPENLATTRSEEWKSDWLLTEKNAELRRVLIQGIGYGKICRDLKAESLDSWREYKLVKLKASIDIEPMVMIKMTCPSTGFVHIHRVPPQMKTARNAIAWVNHETDPEEFAIER